MVKKQINKSKLSIILRMVISFSLLIILFWIMRKDIGGIINILKNSNKLFLVIALSIIMPLTVLLSYRLKLVMSGQKIFLHLKEFVYLTFVGFFFNNFLPTAIGGDLAKAYYASKKTNDKLASYAAVLSDRLFGLLAILAIAMIGLIFIGKSLENNSIIYAVCGAFVLSIILILALLNKKGVNPSSFSEDNPTCILDKIKNKLFKLYYAINLYRNKPILLAKIFFLSIFMQVCTIISVYFFILSIGGNIHILRLFLIIPLVWAISMLPSLNGLGVREGAFVYFLKGSIGAERAFAISLLWLGVILVYSIIGGVLHLVYPQHNTKGTKK